MPIFSDVEKGISRTGVPCVDSYPVRNSVAEIIRNAAGKLGQFYEAVDPKDRPLGDWALPTARSVDDKPLITAKLDQITGKVFGNKLDPDERFRLYFNSYDTAITAVQQEAMAWAQTTLRVLQRAYDEFSRQLIEDMEFSKWMHEAAQQINSRSARCREEIRQQAPAEELLEGAEASQTVRLDLNVNPGLQEEIRRCLVRTGIALVRSYEVEYDPPPMPKIPRELRKTYLERLQFFLVHPKLMNIVNAYEKSPATGATVAAGFSIEASSATEEFTKSLRIGHVWRYPVFIRGGVQRLRLGSVPNFQEFVLDVSVLLARQNLDALLGYWGIASLVLGLAGFGIGIAIVTLALNGAATYDSYFRAHQKELAVRSSALLPDEQKIASTYGYEETALYAFFLGIEVLSHFRPIAKLLESALAARTAAKETLVVKRAAEGAKDLAPHGISRENRLGTSFPTTGDKLSKNSLAEVPGEATETGRDAVLGKRTKSAVEGQVDSRAAPVRRSSLESEPVKIKEKPTEPVTTKEKSSIPVTRSAKFRDVLKEITDELPELRTMLTHDHSDLLDRVIMNVGEHTPLDCVTAATVRTSGKDAARLAINYLEMADEMSHIRNISTLFEDAWKVTKASARRGVDFELAWVYHNRANVAAVAVPRVTGTFERLGADVVLQGGRGVIELKNYSLASEIYSQRAQEIARKLANQVRSRLGEGHTAVKFVFAGNSGEMPAALHNALSAELDLIAQQTGLARSNFAFDFWSF